MESNRLWSMLDNTCIMRSRRYDTDIQKMFMKKQNRHKVIRQQLEIWRGIRFWEVSGKFLEHRPRALIQNLKVLLFSSSNQTFSLSTHSAQKSSRVPKALK
ncbi:hypothetical protein LOD99_1969 [Oopsacas minuta]|uniref:Uncharacterized protein n=1 Tax=Oopsacas minuta TaxID=111878 RepID=A0AAV7K500_9METZ|nr:hypothetical protein LOD99_1936 [Oopsacas minuta]KAI6655828.1 hypothetical protein LOD99_1969 [Oopsacas minuta]